MFEIVRISIKFLVSTCVVEWIEVLVYLVVLVVNTTEWGLQLFTGVGEYPTFH